MSAPVPSRAQPQGLQWFTPYGAHYFRRMVRNGPAYIRKRRTEVKRKLSRKLSSIGKRRTEVKRKLSRRVSSIGRQCTQQFNTATTNVREAARGPSESRMDSFLSFRRRRSSPPSNTASAIVQTSLSAVVTARSRESTKVSSSTSFPHRRNIRRKRLFKTFGSILRDAAQRRDRGAPPEEQGRTDQEGNLPSTLRRPSSNVSPRTDEPSVAQGPPHISPIQSHQSDWMRSRFGGIFSALNRTFTSLTRPRFTDPFRRLQPINRPTGTGSVTTPSNRPLVVLTGDSLTGEPTHPFVFEGSDAQREPIIVRQSIEGHEPGAQETQDSAASGQPNVQAPGSHQQQDPLVAETTVQQLSARLRPGIIDTPSTSQESNPQQQQDNVGNPPDVRQPSAQPFQDFVAGLPTAQASDPQQQQDSIDNYRLDVQQPSAQQQHDPVAALSSYQEAHRQGLIDGPFFTVGPPSTRRSRFVHGLRVFMGDLGMLTHFLHVRCK